MTKNRPPSHSSRQPPSQTGPRRASSAQPAAGTTASRGHADSMSRSRLAGEDASEQAGIDHARANQSADAAWALRRSYPSVVASTFGRRLLPLLYQVRLLTTRQISSLLTPTANDGRYARRQLDAFRSAGMADTVPASMITGRRSRPANPSAQAWYLTTAGAELAETVPGVWQRPYRMSAAKAAGPAQGHLLAVNTVGIAFVQAARAHTGHECGPGDWDLEIVHRHTDRLPGTPPGGLDGCVVSDAVLTYSAPANNGGRWQRQFIIELDNGTMSVPRLVAKLVAYIRYATYRPGLDRNPRAEFGWRRRYTALPTVLVAFTGTDPDTCIRRLQRVREETNQHLHNEKRHHAALRKHLATSESTSPIQIAFTTMDALMTDGPFAEIWLPLDEDQPHHAGAL